MANSPLAKLLEEVFPGQDPYGLRVHDEPKKTMPECACKIANAQEVLSVVLGRYPAKALCGLMGCTAKRSYGMLRPHAETILSYLNGEGSDNMSGKLFESNPQGQTRCAPLEKFTAAGKEYGLFAVTNAGPTGVLGVRVLKGTEDTVKSSEAHSAAFEWPQSISVPTDKIDAVVDLIAPEELHHKPGDYIAAAIIFVRLGAVRTQRGHDETLGMAATPHQNVGERICTGQAQLAKKGTTERHLQVVANLSSYTNYNHGNGRVESFGGQPVLRAVIYLKSRGGKVETFDIYGDEMPVELAILSQCSMAHGMRVDSSDTDPVPHLTPAWATRCVVPLTTSNHPICGSCPAPCVLNPNRFREVVEGSTNIHGEYVYAYTGDPSAPLAQTVGRYGGMDVRDFIPRVVGIRPEAVFDAIGFQLWLIGRGTSACPVEPFSITPGRVAHAFEMFTAGIESLGVYGTGQYAMSGDDALSKVWEILGKGRLSQIPLEPRSNVYSRFQIGMNHEYLTAFATADGEARTYDMWATTFCHGMAEGLGHVIHVSTDAAPARSRVLRNSIFDLARTLDKMLGLPAREEAWPISAEARAFITESICALGRFNRFEPERLRSIIDNPEHKREYLKW